LVADIRFPRQDEPDLGSIISDIVDNLEEAVSSGTREEKNEESDRIPGQRALSKKALEFPPGVKEIFKKPRMFLEEEEDLELPHRLKRLWNKLTQDRASEDSERTADSDPAKQDNIGVETTHSPESERKKASIVEIDLDIRMKDIKASVPVSLFFVH
jgi:hypothetical protein